MGVPFSLFVYGKLIMLTIGALRMHEQSFRFYLAENGAWSTEHMPMSFIHPV
ncbi:hypothetical protein UCMB321_1636 [Pseudomonas batumici]|uniref:Uncharacterized protein n=1 Tax=Pseudomonas batumici TaxID=226910 RepID=A0A0C2I5Y0_9PSED|nr:hypothetical protein UCMB321_1636 [Pseudomonas batumici]